MEFDNLIRGDKVKIVDKRPDHRWNSQMDKWLGKTMTVRSIVHGQPYIKMCEDVGEFGGQGWYWYPEMIDHKVESSGNPVTIKMHIIRDNKTIVRLSNGKVGIARCNPQDTFDVYEGLRIAAARAYGKDPFEVYETLSKPGKVRKVKRQARDGEYVEIVEPDFVSIDAGLEKGQIRKVITKGGCRYVSSSRLVPVGRAEYVVLENYSGEEV